jgi:Ca-activated chloride channel family protein
MFRFGLPEGLYAFFLVPLLLAFLVIAVRSRRRALDSFGDARLVEMLIQSVNLNGRVAKVLLVGATVVLLVTALARPQFGTRVETVRREGQDILVALDLSNSMLAEDMAPNRLDRAKLAISRLIDRLEGDRIGLVAFAGDAFVQSPLTVDYAAAALFLNAMEPGIVPIQGTDLGAALAVSLDAFDEEAGEYRVLVVITDGEDHEGQIDAALEQVVDQGIRVFTVGIGSAEGVPIPDYDASGRRRGFKRDADGNVVTTRLDQETLRRIADETGGEYYHVTSGGTGLSTLADELASGGREIEAQQVTQFEEQYQIFLGIALVLLFVEFFVPDRRRVRAQWSGRFQ